MTKRVRKPSALALAAQQSAREQEDEPDEPDEPDKPEARGRRGKKRAVSEEDEEYVPEEKPEKKKRRRKGGGAAQRAEAPMVTLPPLTDLFEKQDELSTFMGQMRKEAPTYENIAGAQIISGLDATGKRPFLQAVGQLVCFASHKTRGNLGEALMVDHLKRKYPASDGYTVKWLNEHGETGKDHDAEVWQGRKKKKKIKDVESKFSQVFYQVSNPHVIKSGESAGRSMNGLTHAAYRPIFSENEIERVEKNDDSYDVYVSAWCLRRTPDPMFDIDVRFLSQEFLNSADAPSINGRYTSNNLGYPLETNKYDVPMSHTKSIHDKYHGSVCEMRVRAGCEA